MLHIAASTSTSTNPSPSVRSTPSSADAAVAAAVGLQFPGIALKAAAPRASQAAMMVLARESANLAPLSPPWCHQAMGGARHAPRAAPAATGPP